MLHNVVPSAVEPEAHGREITGRTRVLGILAHPTDHVKAPPEINRIARERGRDAIMVPFSIAPTHLADFVSSLRRLESFDGSIVTVPHKQAILSHCDDLTSHARLVGAANIIRRDPDGSIVGGQLDGIGFVGGLQSQGIALSAKSVYLVGAGGAASAIAFAVAEAGASRLTLVNRSVEKISGLKSRIQAAYPSVEVELGTSDASGHDIVVNGTTLGMKLNDPMPLDAKTLTPGMTVAEVVMEPQITPLLAAAREAGCRIHLGKHMLTCQLELMATFMGL